MIFPSNYGIITLARLNQHTIINCDACDARYYCVLRWSPDFTQCRHLIWTSTILKHINTWIVSFEVALTFPIHLLMLLAELLSDSLEMCYSVIGWGSGRSQRKKSLILKDWPSWWQNTNNSRTNINPCGTPSPVASLDHPDHVPIKFFYFMFKNEFKWRGNNSSPPFLLPISPFLLTNYPFIFFQAK